MSSIANSEIIFIINPNSGSKRYNHLIRKIKRIDPELTCIVTHHNETVKQLFERHADKYKAFIVVGGDGTVHEAARYLYNQEDKIMGVVPNGSGNGFAFELGFNRNIKSLIEDIQTGESMKLDVLEINGNECINLSGLGFDSYVAHRFSKGKTRGLFTYMVISIRALFQFKAINATILINNNKINGRFQMICVANNKQFGNYAFIAPYAKPNDGIIDVVLIKPFPFYYYPGFIARMFLGKLKDSRYIQYFKTSNPLTITAATSEFHIDGEPVLLEGPVTVRLADKYLKVLRTRNNRI